MIISRKKTFFLFSSGKFKVAINDEYYVELCSGESKSLEITSKNNQIELKYKYLNYTGNFKVKNLDSVKEIILYAEGIFNIDLCCKVIKNDGSELILLNNNSNSNSCINSIQASTTTIEY